MSHPVYYLHQHASISHQVLPPPLVDPSVARQVLMLQAPAASAPNVVPHLQLVDGRFVQVSTPLQQLPPPRSTPFAPLPLCAMIPISAPPPLGALPGRAQSPTHTASRPLDLRVVQTLEHAGTPLSPAPAGFIHHSAPDALSERMWSVPSMLTLQAVRTLTASGLGSDNDIADYIKRVVPHDACMALRDLLVGPSLDAALEFERQCTEHRGVVIATIMEVLSSSPTDDEMWPLVARACSLTAKLGREQRGCIALMRFLCVAARSRRAVDAFLHSVARAMPRLVTDAHGNYIISGVLQSCAVGSSITAPLYTPTPREAVLTSTRHVMSCSGRVTRAADDDGRRTATASAAAWGDFCSTLVAALVPAVGEVGLHRAASHVLEHALRRVPEMPQGLELVLSLTDRGDTVLASYCRSRCGWHCAATLLQVLPSLHTLLTPTDRRRVYAGICAMERAAAHAQYFPRLRADLTRAAAIYAV